MARPIGGLLKIMKQFFKTLFSLLDLLRSSGVIALRAEGFGVGIGLIADCLAYFSMGVCWHCVTKIAAVDCWRLGGIGS